LKPKASEIVLSFHRVTSVQFAYICHLNGVRGTVTDKSMPGTMESADVPKATVETLESMEPPLASE